MPDHRQFLAAANWGVLATVKADGRPQLSNINYGYDADADLIRISTTAHRAKVHNLRRDPRASLHVTTDGGGAYMVAEGTATLSAVATQRDDAAVAELIDLYRAVSGEHPDWDDYRRAMVEDRRLVIRIAIDRTYGWAG